LAKEIDILDCLDDYLEYLKLSGIDYVPKSTPAKCGAAYYQLPDQTKELGTGRDKSIKPDEKTLSDIRQDMGECKRCGLHKTRSSIVFGAGNNDADLLFVGEAPGRDEDLQGEPFVGKAGKLLSKIIEAIDMRREEVYISNIIKCRPPENRNPLPDEIESCKSFLLQQIKAIRPKIICTLGKFAAQTLLETDAPISTMRGRFHDFRGIPLMPTYHPAYLLRNPGSKREVWEDIKKVRDLLNNKR